VKIAICDDESLFRSRLSKSIDLFEILSCDKSVDEFSNGQLLIDGHEKDPFDVIFLDIEMDGISGLEAGKKIRSADKKVLIILVTSHAHYMKQSFKIEPFDYITKPYEDKEIHDVLGRALRKYSDQNKKIELKWKGNTHVLNVGNIVYINIEERYLLFVTKSKASIVKCTGQLDHYDRLLTPHGFFRCHKSYLINMEFVSAIKGKTIIMANGDILSISTRKKREFLSAYNEFATKYKV